MTTVWIGKRELGGSATISEILDAKNFLEKLGANSFTVYAHKRMDEWMQDLPCISVNGYRTQQ